MRYPKLCLNLETSPHKNGAFFQPENNLNPVNLCFNQKRALRSIILTRPFPSLKETVFVNGNTAEIRISERTIKTLKTDSPILRAVWATFTSLTTEPSVRMLCLLTNGFVHIFDLRFECSQICVLDFNASGIWVLPEGILIEKSLETNNESTLKPIKNAFAPFFQKPPPTRFFYLGHPLETPVPVSFFDPLTRNAPDPREKNDFDARNIVFTDRFRPIVVTFNSVTNAHELFLLKRSLNEFNMRLSFNNSLMANNVTNTKKGKAFGELGGKGGKKGKMEKRGKSQKEGFDEKTEGAIALQKIWESGFKSECESKVFLASDYDEKCLLCFWNPKEKHFFAHKLSAKKMKIKTKPILAISNCISAAPIISNKSNINRFDANFSKSGRNNAKNGDNLRNIAQLELFEKASCDFSILILENNGKLSLWSGGVKISDILLSPKLSPKNRPTSLTTSPHIERITLHTKTSENFSFAVDLSPKSKLVFSCLGAIKAVLKPRLSHLLQTHFIAFSKTKKRLSPPKNAFPKNAEFSLFQKFLLQTFSPKTRFLSSNDLLFISNSLHSLYEAFKLNEKHQKLYLKPLAELLANVNLISNRVNYVQYYRRDFPDLKIIKNLETLKTMTGESKPMKTSVDFLKNRSGEHPFDVYKWVTDTLRGLKPKSRAIKSAFLKPFELIRKVCLFVEIVSKSLKDGGGFEKKSDVQNRFENSFENSFNGSFSLPFKMCPTPKTPPAKGKNENEFLLLSPIKFHVKSTVFIDGDDEDAKPSLATQIIEEKFKKKNFEKLPWSIKAVLLWQLEQELKAGDFCIDKVAEFAEIFRILERKDLENNFSKSSSKHSTENKEISTAPQTDQPAFPSDLRLNEVDRCLSSSRPNLGPIQNSAEIEEIAAGSVTQKRQAAVANYFRRNCAVAFGKGLFLFDAQPEPKAAEMPFPAEISLATRFRGCGRVFEAETASKRALEAKKVGVFHNAAALALSFRAQGAGARLRLSCRQIVSFLSRDPHAHAGFLLGLGLRGRLRGLTSSDLFEYFQRQREVVTAALVLGFAGDAAGSKDGEILKMVSLNLPALMPQTLTQNEKAVSANLQNTALISIGLLFFASGNAAMSRVVLNIIEKSAENGDEFEFGKLFLCAALSLGLINFGVANRAAHFCPPPFNNQNPQNANADILAQIDKTLLSLALGGARKQPPRPAPSFSENFNLGDFDNFGRSVQFDNFGRFDADPAAESAQTVLGDQIDLFVTSPGAMLCLGMAYFASGDRRIAKRLAVPTNSLFLKNCRAELLFYRVLGRNLVLWGEVEPAAEWLERQMPVSRGNERCFPLFAFAALGCFSALALKMAGSFNGAAKALMFAYLKRVTGAKALLTEAQFKAFRVSQAVNLAVLMAGSGDLAVFGVLRRLRRVENNFNNSEMELISMAIGILFLGKGKWSFKKSNLAVAALLIATLPILITSSCLLTSTFPFYLRYLWVLSTEKRFLVTKNVGNGRFCDAKFSVFTKNNAFLPKKRKSPCLLGEPLDLIEKVKLSEKRFFAQNIKFGPGLNSVYYVKSVKPNVPSLDKKLGFSETAFSMAGDTAWSVKTGESMRNNQLNFGFFENCSVISCFLPFLGRNSNNNLVRGLIFNVENDIWRKRDDFGADWKKCMNEGDFSREIAAFLKLNGLPLPVAIENWAQSGQNEKMYKACSSELEKWVFVAENSDFLGEMRRFKELCHVLDLYFFGTARIR